MPILFNWFSIPKPLFLPIVFEGQGVNSVVATEYMCRPHVPCLAHTRNSVLMLPYCLQLVVTFLLGEKKKNQILWVRYVALQKSTWFVCRRPGYLIHSTTKKFCFCTYISHNAINFQDSNFAHSFYVDNCSTHVAPFLNMIFSIWNSRYHLTKLEYGWANVKVKHMPLYFINEEAQETLGAQRIQAVNETGNQWRKDWFSLLELSNIYFCPIFHPLSLFKENSSSCLML